MTSKTLSRLALGASAATVGALLAVPILATAANAATLPAPTVTSVNPTNGPQSGGTTVVVTGTGYQDSAGKPDVTAVDFGATPATSFTVNSSTQLTVTSPNSATSGAVDVTVTTNPSSVPGGTDTGGGTSATSAADKFTYNPAPAVTGVTPSGGPSAGGTSVAIGCTNCDSTGATQVTGVKFGATPATSFIATTGSVSAVSPAHADGPVVITLTTANGSSSGTAAPGTNVYTYFTGPTITSLSQTTGSMYGPGASTPGAGQVVTITGTGFEDSNGSADVSSVSFGHATAANVAVLSATQLAVVVPAEATADKTGGVSTGAPTTVPVTVVTSPPGSPGGGVGTTATSAGAFTYTTAPVVTVVGDGSTDNSNAALSTGQTGITVKGMGLANATGVTFGGTPGAITSNTSAGGAQTITVTAPPHAPGPVDVIFTTSDVGSTSTRAADTLYYYTATPPAATITSLSPTSGPTANNTPVKIAGTTLSTTTAVMFGNTTAGTAGNPGTPGSGGVSANFVVPSSTEVDTTAPTTAASTKGVEVDTAENGVALSSTGFTYTAAPTVTNVNPNTGSTAGGTRVLISGTNFTGVTAVNFGSTPATTFSVSGGVITAYTPAESAGTVDVTVTAAGGTSAANPSKVPSCNPTAVGAACGDSFTFQGAVVTNVPTVTGVSPNTGPTTGGTSVTVTGSNFVTGNTTVKFGSVAATNVTVNTASSLTATTPAEGPGAVDVTVTTPNGTSATSSADQFTFTGPAVNNGDYVPMAPSRILSDQSISPNSTYTFTLPSSVPAGTGAVAFNVTAVNPNTVGNLRVYPACGSSSTPPNISLVNYQPGHDTANFLVISLLCPDGTLTNKVNFYSANSSVAVDVDLAGTYPSKTTGSSAAHAAVTTVPGFTGIGPTREVSAVSIPANTSKNFPLTGLPSGATAVAINVTSIHQNGPGNLRVYPGAQKTVPASSNVNFVPGVDKAGFVIVPLDSSNSINIYSAGSTDSVDVDVFGAFPAGSSTTAVAPQRVLDTRAGSGMTQGLPDPLQIGTQYNVTVTGGTTTVPANASAVIVSLTAIHAKGSSGVGNLRAFPAGGTTPGVSNINYIGPDNDVANLAIVQVGKNGQITLVTNGSVIDAAVDVLGYVPAAPTS